jgi:hypothetical protein
MGTIPITRSLVSDWGQKELENSFRGPRYDSLEVRVNHRTLIAGIGIVRPIDGQASATVMITDIKQKRLLYQEELKVEPNFVEDSDTFEFKSKVVLHPNRIYRIQVCFYGSPCYTYKLPKGLIKYEEHEMQMRKSKPESLEKRFRFMNLITDLRYKELPKQRGCGG